MQLKRSTWILLAVIAVVGFLLIKSVGSLYRVEIVFDRAPDINENSILVYESKKVGSVTKTDVDESGRIVVTAQVAREDWKTVNSSSVFIIEDSASQGSRKHRNIIVKVIHKDHPPFEPKTRVEGFSSSADFLIKYGKKALEETVKSLEGVFGDAEDDENK